MQVPEARAGAASMSVFARVGTPADVADSHRPHCVDTEVGRPLIEAGVIGRIPVGRAGLGHEIAQTVLLLARNAFITGQTIGVNGGALLS